MAKSEEIQPMAWGGWEGPTKPCDLIYIYIFYKNITYLLSSPLVVPFRYLFLRFLCFRQAFNVVSLSPLATP